MRSNSSQALQKAGEGRAVVSSPYCMVGRAEASTARTKQCAFAYPQDEMAASWRLMVLLH